MQETNHLKAVWVHPAKLPEADAVRVLGQPIEKEYSLFELLRRPQVGYGGLLSLPGAGEPMADAAVAEQVEIAAKYQGYIDRQREEVARLAEQEALVLPADIDYGRIAGLSIEIRQKLARQRPETLGQAGRMSGVTPAALAILLVYAKRGFPRLGETARSA